MPHTMLQNGSHSVAVEVQELLVVGKLSQAACVLQQHGVAPLHLLIEFHADLENFLEVVLVIVKQFVHIPVADQNYFHVNINRFRFQRSGAEWKEHIQRLNLEFSVIECPFQGPVNASFRKRVHRIHYDEAAIRSQQRSAAQIHEVGIPASARIITAMNRSE